METYEKRLKRLQSGPPIEAIETVLNSIDNFFVTQELSRAAEEGLGNLLILGIHAVAEIVSELVYGKVGLDGLKFYLENFVDGEKQDCKFSKIAAELNTWRNILAHQWISSMGHEWGYDYSVREGWRRDNGRVIINPKIYFECFDKGFDGPIWNYDKFLDEKGLEEAKNRIIKKFLKR